jgi:hypothetical protein
MLHVMRLLRDWWTTPRHELMRLASADVWTMYFRMHQLYEQVRMERNGFTVAKGFFSIIWILQDARNRILGAIRRLEECNYLGRYDALIDRLQNVLEVIDAPALNQPDRPFGMMACEETIRVPYGEEWRSIAEIRDQFDGDPHRAAMAGRLLALDFEPTILRLENDLHAILCHVPRTEITREKQVALAG